MEANTLLKPLHDRVLRLQDEQRAAFMAMNASLHEDGLDMADAYKALLVEESNKLG
jgi:putative SOS response-associated peptidase YedK